jgi:hypothetical protein
MCPRHAPGLSSVMSGNAPRYFAAFDGGNLDGDPRAHPARGDKIPQSEALYLRGDEIVARLYRARLNRARAFLAYARADQLSIDR